MPKVKGHRSCNAVHGKSVLVDLNEVLCFFCLKISKTFNNVQRYCSKDKISHSHTDIQTLLAKILTKSSVDGVYN